METVIHLTTLPLSALLPPKDNPRRVIDKSLIAGLAQSIRSGEILQNLLVRPDGPETYRVIFGKRRFLALQLLKREGAIGDDYQVPVGIKVDMTDDDARWFSAVENVQREPLHPLDEAEDFAKLLQSGGALEILTARTGLSATTLKRRVALATLAPEVKKAFRAGLFGRLVAEALTLGSREQQRGLLESFKSEDPPDAGDIREIVLEQKPTLAMAIFPREKYRGSLTTDLFADEETTYFDDVDQFLTLHKEAVDALAVERRVSAAFVDSLSLYTVPWWQYRDAQDGEPSGVVINLHPTGVVEVRDGLVRHSVDEPAAQATRVSPIAPRARRERPEFSSELLRYAACQRSAAMQAALLADPRKGKEVAVLLLLLGFRRDFGVDMDLHACHAAAAQEKNQRSHRSISAVAGPLAVALGCGSGEADQGQTDGVSELAEAPDAFMLSETIGRVAEQDLDQLLVILPLLCFGQEYVDLVDDGESLVNTMAARVGITTRAWWTPDNCFLTLLTREQLLTVARAVEAAPQLVGMNGWTKKRLVAELAAYFASHASSAQEADRPAYNWLPGILRFPAVKTLDSETA